MAIILSSSQLIASDVCHVKGHNIGRLAMTVDEHGNILTKPVVMCFQCGMTLAEIRGEDNAPSS